MFIFLSFTLLEGRFTLPSVPGASTTKELQLSPQQRAIKSLSDIVILPHYLHCHWRDPPSLSVLKESEGKYHFHSDRDDNKIQTKVLTQAPNCSLHLLAFNQSLTPPSTDASNRIWFFPWPQQWGTIPPTVTIDIALFLPLTMTGHYSSPCHQ